VLKTSSLFLLYRFLAFDGLCLMIPQPFSWLASFMVTRFLIVNVPSLFMVFSGFFDGDLTPQLLIMTWTALFLLGGMNAKLLSQHRFHAIVVFVVAPFGWIHKTIMLSISSELLTNHVVDVFGNETREGAFNSAHSFLLEHSLMNFYGSASDHALEPDETLIFKNFDPEKGKQCFKEISLFPTDGHLARNVKNMREGKLQMDVYLAENRHAFETKPVVVYIHGGAWRVGGTGLLVVNNRGGLIPRHLLDQGVSIIAISYRLTCTGASGQDMLQDIDDAISSVRENAGQWKIDKDLLILWGISAGAHLSLTYSYSRSTPFLRGVVSFYGPTELRPEKLYAHGRTIFDKFQTQIFLESTKSLCPEGQSEKKCREELSPVALVHKNAPPTLLIHGTSDPLVPIFQAHSLRNELELKGAKHALLELPCSTHNSDVLCSSAFAQTARFAFERFVMATID